MFDNLAVTPVEPGRSRVDNILIAGRSTGAELASDHFTNSQLVLVCTQLRTLCQKVSAQAGESDPKLTEILKIVEKHLATGPQKIDLLLHSAYQLRKHLCNTHLPEQQNLQIELTQICDGLAKAKIFRDLPKISADGLIRKNIYYKPPGVLSGQRLAIGKTNQFDVIILGGGPSGISALYHLSKQGVDTLLIEGGFCVQSMSDARALSVHTMRTDVTFSSITGSGEHTALREEIRMNNLMDTFPIRACAEHARQTLEKSAGVRLDATFATGNDRESPVARAEVYAYFSQVLDEAANLPSANILEQSPIVKVQKNPDGLFQIQTASGDVYLSKKLIVAAGFVGLQAEFARTLSATVQLEQAYGERVITISSEQDVYFKADRIEAAIKGLATVTADPLVVLNEAVLGHLEVRTLVKLQPPGTRAAVVGSGESAAKSVIELLTLNPNLQVDLFLKAPLEPSDPQSPAYLQAGPKLLRCLADSKFAEQSMELRKQFSTPVTFETMKRLIELTQTGQVRVFELGSHFSESCLELKINEDNKLTVGIKKESTALQKDLLKQHLEWTAFSLKCDWIRPEQIKSGQLSANVGLVLVSAGYENINSRRQQKKDSGVTGMIDLLLAGQSSVRLSGNGLTPEGDPNIAYVGAIAQCSFADTGFYGGGLRAALLAEYFASGKDPLAEVASQLPNWRRQDLLRYSELVKTKTCDRDSADVFNGTPGLVKLEEQSRSSGDLSDSKRFLLHRGHALRKRMEDSLMASLLVTGRSEESAESIKSP